MEATKGPNSLSQILVSANLVKALKEQLVRLVIHKTSVWTRRRM